MTKKISFKFFKISFITVQSLMFEAIMSMMKIWTLFVMIIVYFSFGEAKPVSI